MANIIHVHDVDPHSPSYTPANTIRDTYISGHDLELNKNFGAEATFHAGRINNAEKGTVERRALVYYDLTRFIPKSAVLSSAFWRFYVAITDATADHTFILERVIRTDWVEPEATWNIYKTGNNWTTAGCGSDGNDYDSTVNAPLGALTTTGWKAINIMGVVNDAWQNRAGLCTFRMLRNDTRTTEVGHVEVYSKERLTEFGFHDAPHLRITYSLADKTFQVTLR